MQLFIIQRENTVLNLGLACSFSSWISAIHYEKSRTQLVAEPAALAADLNSSYFWAGLLQLTLHIQKKINVMLSQ